MEMLICGQPPTDLPYRAATNLGVDLRPGCQRPEPGGRHQEVPGPASDDGGEDAAVRRRPRRWTETPLCVGEAAEAGAGMRHGQAVASPPRALCSLELGCF